MAKEAEFHLGIVEGRKEVKDIAYFPNSMIDDVPSARDVADRCPEEEEAGVSGARDIAIKGIGDVDIQRKRFRFATPHQ